MRSKFQEAAQDNVRKDLGHAYRNFKETRDFLDESAAEIATTKEYVDWLVTYFKKGGKVGLVMEGEMGNSIHTVRHDARLPELHGASRVTIIVPCGIHIEDSGLGHSALYKHDGSSTDTYGVTLFQDTVRALKYRGYSLEDLKKRYTGPEWSREDDMGVLERVFSEPEPNGALTRDLPVRSKPLDFKK